MIVKFLVLNSTIPFTTIYIYYNAERAAQDFDDFTRKLIGYRDEVVERKRVEEHGHGSNESHIAINFSVKRLYLISNFTGLNAMPILDDILSAQTLKVSYAAQSLNSAKRQEICIQAIGGYTPISHVANRYDVSRKFIYQ